MVGVDWTTRALIGAAAGWAIAKTMKQSPLMWSLAGAAAGYAQSVYAQNLVTIAAQQAFAGAYKKTGSIGAAVGAAGMVKK